MSIALQEGVVTHLEDLERSAHGVGDGGVLGERDEVKVELHDGGSNPTHEK